jgi:hypothetical protein
MLGFGLRVDQGWLATRLGESLALFNTEQKHEVLQPTALNRNLVPRFEI